MKSWEGAVVWCSVGDGEEVRNEGRREVFASSALMAEALAVWYALAWAFDRGWLSVEICSDCLVLVQGFQKANRVHPLVRNILSDIVHLACKFNYVVVSKVSRTKRGRDAADAGELTMVGDTVKGRERKRRRQSDGGRVVVGGSD
ncbi:hypothetical protein RHMOL_Rhmol09G0063600 [Rhododendron molle]|uniref:Uncharacterized protein n=1 Tax=Rhododendron molle TaxID=49168 RepID=A0ACC0MAI3_RHOML|nr:hypothetical protein RHMOL_Rhmol09G0063600 [Rhododendron molle]